MHWVGKVKYCAFISVCICTINREIIFMRLCWTFHAISCHLSTPPENIRGTGFLMFQGGIERD